MVKRTRTTPTLDAKDRLILRLVQRDATLAQAGIAKKVGLSTASVNERLKKLEAAGVILRWTAVVDPRLVVACAMLAVMREVVREQA